MYKITLTADERRAFDFNGDNYNCGDVYRLLLDCLPEGVEWVDECDIHFRVPEHVAWQIGRYAHEENYEWPNFSVELRQKLNGFCMNVV